MLFFYNIVFELAGLFLSVYASGLTFTSVMAENYKAVAVLGKLSKRIFT